MRAGYEVFGLFILADSPDEILHGFCILGETYGILQKIFGVLPGEGFKVGDEVITSCHVGLSLLVITPVNGVIGPLEEPVFRVDTELYRRILIRWVQALKFIRWNHDAGGDVIFPLDLV